MNALIMDSDWYDDENEILSDDPAEYDNAPFFDDADFSSVDADLWPPDSIVIMPFRPLQFTAPQEIIEKPPAESTAPLLNLPNEILLQILEYQEKDDRIIFGLTCRRLLQLLAMLPPSAVTFEMVVGVVPFYDMSTEVVREQLLSCRRRYPMLHPCSMFPRIGHADQNGNVGGAAYEQDAREKDKHHKPEDSDQPTESAHNDGDAPAETFEREQDESLQKLLDARPPACTGSGSPLAAPWTARPVWYAEHAVARRCLDCSVHQGQTWWILCEGCCKYMPRSPLYWREFAVSPPERDWWSDYIKHGFGDVIDQWKDFDSARGRCPTCEWTFEKELGDLPGYEDELDPDFLGSDEEEEEG